MTDAIQVSVEARAGPERRASRMVGGVLIELACGQEMAESSGDAHGTKYANNQLPPRVAEVPLYRKIPPARVAP